MNLNQFIRSNFNKLKKYNGKEILLEKEDFNKLSSNFKNK